MPRLNYAGLYTAHYVRMFKTYKGARRYARVAHLPVFWIGGAKGWAAVRHRQL